MSNIARLQQLADHLLTGKLGHKVFYFNCFNKIIIGDLSKNPENTCGTHGCAIGECPILWPEYWHFDEVGYPIIKGEFFVFDSIQTFFGLSEFDAEYLFTDWHNKKLTGNSTKEEVAAQILLYIASQSSPSSSSIG